MMCNRKQAVAIVAVLFLSSFGFAASDKHAGPGPTETASKVWLVGDSSLHTYSSTAHQLKVDFTFSPDKSIAQQLESGAPSALEVVIPVAEMRSGKDGLDKNLQKALRAAEFPKITFQMNDYKVQPSTSSNQEWLVTATGILEVAGAKKEMALDGIIKKKEGEIQIQGKKDLLMTDFGVKPPKILVIKTSNEVTVYYDLRLDEKGQLK